MQSHSPLILTASPRTMRMLKAPGRVASLMSRLYRGVSPRRLSGTITSPRSQRTKRRDPRVQSLASRLLRSPGPGAVVLQPSEAPC